MRKIIAFFTAAVLAVFMIPTSIPAISSLFSRDDTQTADENTGAIPAGSVAKPCTGSVTRADINPVESYTHRTHRMKGQSAGGTLRSAERNLPGFGRPG